MTVTINYIQVNFTAIPPTVTFLQGCDMDITNIRNTLRAIEQTPEGREQEYNMYGGMVTASGNELFTETSSSALTIKIRAPFVMAFEGGSIPFITSGGNLLGTTVDSPGAYVQINNAIATMIAATETETLTRMEKKIDDTQALTIAM